MTPLRKPALVAGIFYLITFISIPTLGLYGSMKTDQNFVISSGSNTGVLWGAFLEVIVALAGIGTAVKGFRPSLITADMVPASSVPARSVVPV